MSYTATMSDLMDGAWEPEQRQTMPDWIASYRQRHEKRNPNKAAKATQGVFNAFGKTDWIAERMLVEEFPSEGLSDAEKARRRSLIGAVLRHMPERQVGLLKYARAYSSLFALEVLREDRDRYPDRYDGLTYRDLREAPWRRALAGQMEHREDSDFARSVTQAYDDLVQHREALKQRYPLDLPFSAFVRALLPTTPPGGPTEGRRHISDELSDLFS